MRLRALTFILATVALVVSACITDPRPTLLIVLDPAPPDTVEQNGVSVNGRVDRTPPDLSRVFTVTTITTSPRGVDTTVVETGSIGNFTVRIPIARDTLGVANDVAMIANDDTEDVISKPFSFTIIGLLEVPVLRGGND